MRLTTDEFLQMVYRYAHELSRTGCPDAFSEVVVIALHPNGDASAVFSKDEKAIDACRSVIKNITLAEPGDIRVGNIRTNN